MYIIQWNSIGRKKKDRGHGILSREVKNVGKSQIMTFKTIRAPFLRVLRISTKNCFFPIIIFDAWIVQL
jgi:hypothetical protein